MSLVYIKEVMQILSNSTGVELEELHAEDTLESLSLTSVQMYVFLSSLEDAFMISLPDSLLFSQTTLKSFAQYIEENK